MTFRLITPCIGLALLFGVVSASTIGAQEGAGRIAAPPSPAVPAGPGAPSEFATLPAATGPGTTASGSPPVAVPLSPDPPMTPAPDPALPPAMPSTPAPPSPALPNGATVGAEQAQSRIIEEQRPERVQVFPEDPESAWWEINPHYAFDRAQREQRPLMLLFTGAWNTQAMALSQEVFATKSFNNFVKENLVICYLNFPKNITDAPDALRKIKDRYKVKGYPNVLIFNPNGEVERGIRGYRSGRPVDYFNELTVACRPVLESVKIQKTELIARGYRDWSNFLGKMIFARFVKHDKVQVMLEDASGQKWTIPINDLAPEDQKLVESFPGVDKVGER